MANTESKHDVRRKVREAQAKANRERLKRESDNREDMVAFLLAEQKLAAVDMWESERHDQVRIEADQRRSEQRMEGARALERMRERGESIFSIAQIGGCSEKLVRTYLRDMRTTTPAPAGDAGGAGVPGSEPEAAKLNGSQPLGPAAAGESMGQGLLSRVVSVPANSVS
jgi:hypothetical protein